MINFLNPRERNLAGYTLIVPTVAVGNVAQLAADLCISTLKMDKIGVGWHSAIIPILGPAAFAHNQDNLSVSCELYASHQHKLAVIQLRSPIVAARLDSFLDCLCNFLQNQSLLRIIILSSSFSYEKHNINSNPIGYIMDELTKANFTDEINSLNLMEFEGSVLHGGGFAMKLKNKLDTLSIPVMLLFKYVSEGDNSSDALHLINCVNELLKIMGTDYRWVAPISWKLLFGNSAPELLY